MRAPLLLSAVLLAGVAGCGDEGGEAGSAAAPPAIAAAAEGPSSAAARPAPAPVSSPSPPPAVVAEGDGRLVVVPGDGPVSGTGTPTAYVVEVEGGLGVDAAAFAAEVEQVLADPRSWGAEGRRAMRRVSSADTPDGEVAFRVALSSPRTTDRLCAPLRTVASYSCASGDRAVLNAKRWLTGAESYAGRLTQYRQYLVNHEVGHTLGHGHEGCPGEGEPAPVMLQQTKGLAGCAHNAWPYP